MLALTLDQATIIAVEAVAALIGLAVASAWLMTGIMQEVALVVILGLLAVLVWTRRASLDECAETVRATGASIDDRDRDTPCSFFDQDIQITRTSES
jgi:hypothetical protein